MKISISAVGKIQASLSCSTKIALKHPPSNHQVTMTNKEKVHISAKSAKGHFKNKKLTSQG
jgi:hypothetical protein